MRPDLLFATDLHGDTNKMKLLVQKACEMGSPTILLGGDLLRTGGGSSLRNGMELLREANSIFEAYDSSIWTTYGNNDWALVMDKMEELCPSIGVLGSEPIGLDCGVDVIGFPFVPVTPFPIKDWERIERSGPPDARSSTRGLCSRSGQVLECEVEARRTLWDELSELEGTEGSILVSHTPPYGTAADMGYGGPLGSKDLLKYVEQHRPLAVLCGHIHESPRRSGKAIEDRGRILISNPGSFSDLLTMTAIDVNEGFKAKYLKFGMYRDG